MSYSTFYAYSIRKAFTSNITNIFAYVGSKSQKSI